MPNKKVWEYLVVTGMQAATPDQMKEWGREGWEFFMNATIPSDKGLVVIGWAKREGSIIELASNYEKNPND